MSDRMRILEVRELPDGRASIAIQLGSATSHDIQEASVSPLHFSSAERLAEEVHRSSGLDITEALEGLDGLELAAHLRHVRASSMRDVDDRATLRARHRGTDQASERLHLLRESESYREAEKRIGREGRMIDEAMRFRERRRRRVERPSARERARVIRDASGELAAALREPLEDLFSDVVGALRENERQTFVGGVRESERQTA